MDALISAIGLTLKISFDCYRIRSLSNPFIFASPVNTFDRCARAMGTSRRLPVWLSPAKKSPGLARRLKWTFMTSPSHAQAVRTLRCRTVAEGALRQANYIRDLPVQGASELDLTGEGSVPNGLESLLAAFGACLVAGIHANALARHMPITKIEVNLEGEVYKSAHWGTSDIEPNPVGFQSIQAMVVIEADVPRQELERLLKHSLLWSPVGNTLFNPVGLDVRLAP